MPSSFITMWLVTLLFMTGLCTSFGCDQLQTEVETGCNSSSLILTNSDGSTQLTVDASNCGKEFSKTAWASTPSIRFPEAQQNASYTIVALDPDAPINNAGEYVMHYLVANVPGTALAAGNIGSGETIEAYISPAPPNGSGKHRYIFLALGQSSTKVTLKAPENRITVNFLNYLQQQDGQLCGIEAASMFLAAF